MRAIDTNVLVRLVTREKVEAAIRKIGFNDLADALAKGWDDFSAMPSHAIFLCLIYPLVGIFLIGLAFGYSVLPLLFPLAAGFALIGPVAAVGISNQRGSTILWKRFSRSQP